MKNSYKITKITIANKKCSIIIDVTIQKYLNDPKIVIFFVENTMSCPFDFEALRDLDVFS